MNTTASTPQSRALRCAPRHLATRGLTLVELLAVLAIAAVLAGVGVPSMARILQSVQLSTASNAFMSSLRLARSEARKRGSRVAMCKSPDGLACVEAGGWEQGWLVFHDPNGNGVLEPGETLIQRTDALGGDLVFRGNRLVAGTITYVALGGTRGVAGGLQAGTLTLCRRSGEPAPGRQIIISTGGRPRLQPVNMESCE